MAEAWAGRRRGARLLDLLLWACLTLPLAVEQLAMPRSGALRWGLVAAGAAVAGAAVLLARRRPLWALGLPVAAAVLLWSVDISAPSSALAPFALVAAMAYLAGRRLAEGRPVLVLTGWLAAAGLLLGIGVRAVQDGVFGAVTALHSWIVLAIALVIALLLPWLFARYRTTRAELAVAGWQRAAWLERERRITAEQARLRERSRIAQEMHDSLGHELSLIALRAAALELAPGADERTRAQAGEVRAGLADATARLREIVGVLRPGTGVSAADDGADTLGMQSGGADIDALVRRAAAAGMSVRLERSGPEGEVPDAVRRAAHRIVQEALTNAAKHAPGAAVAVAVGHGRETTSVTVRNGPAPAGGGGRAPGGRQGLAGLAERARMLGGTLAAGPDGAGFTVRAELPHRAARAVADADLAEEPDGGGESVRRFASGRERVRHSLTAAVVVPVVGCLGLALAVVGLELYVNAGNEFDRAGFQALSVGQDRAEVERVLPRFQRLGGPPVAEPPPPPGAECRYYWSGEPVNGEEIYRVCFTGDRLADATAIPRSALSVPGD
ncbi:sensor histidine kinase [Allonocardiopsis opalescens]|uniref:histidine kinase n=1 Tax=Allonocardiopsis opalescens TaxID=1144618 RepID=A0A2T0Q2X0_9ACTN|nr:histidine kinase [Allonocardiopsis opalescens]PRX98142.1 signal transduction histidine kinase [Allonocardiopsis opalescens]